MTGRALLIAAVVAALAVPAAYAALGGADYKPREVSDPCLPREWRDPDGLQETAEQVLLSTLDGAACTLGVSREELTLVFQSRSDLERFLRLRGISDQEAEDALRDGFSRAIEDGRRAGSLNLLEAYALRQLVQTLPIDEVLRRLQDADIDW